MHKVKINMIGGGFQHCLCSSARGVPEYIEWDKSGNANISIYIDEAIRLLPNKTKRNYAWISEASIFLSSLITWISNNVSYLEDNFELIFTHDKRLLVLSDKIKLVKCASKPWVTDIKIHNKNKMISMIASTKVYCNTHIHRQTVLQRYKDEIDCFGQGHNYIVTKEEGLNDYYFSIAMENDNYPNMFSEKLTDCFATGTIPIYWGMPSIGEFFNVDGIIILTDDFKINDLSSDLYFSKMESILENFETTVNIPIAEDYIFKSFIEAVL